jgi:hypothetical protein
MNTRYGTGCGYRVTVCRPVQVSQGILARTRVPPVAWADGVVLVPLWLIWTGRAGGFQPERASARPGAVARARARS